MSQGPDFEFSAPDARAVGEPPPPRPGVRTYAELRALVAKNPEAVTELVDEERVASLSRVRRPGEIVAHYTTGPTALLAILPNATLRMHAYSLMSDPRENKDWVNYSVLTRTGSSPSLEDMERRMAEPPRLDMSKATILANAARQQQTKLLSLTGERAERSSYEDFSRAYARPRMWDQYADGHRGVCLVFDRSLLAAQMELELERVGTWWAGEVHYDTPALVDGGLTAFRLDGNELLRRGGLTAGLREHLQAHHKLLFFTKLDDYADENEYRYAVFDGTDDDYVDVPFGDALIAVVLGEAFPADQLAGARKACEAARAGEGVALRQMAWTQYAAIAEPIVELEAS